MSINLSRRVAALELLRAGTGARSVFELSDAELLRLAGLPPGATTADLERVAAAGGGGREGGATDAP